MSSEGGREGREEGGDRDRKRMIMIKNYVIIKRNGGGRAYLDLKLCSQGYLQCEMCMKMYLQLYVHNIYCSH